MKIAAPYTLRKGDDTHPMLENHRNRDACYTCLFRLQDGHGCGYLKSRHKRDIVVPTTPSSICELFEDASELPF